MSCFCELVRALVSFERGKRTRRERADSNGTVLMDERVDRTTAEINEMFLGELRSTPLVPTQRLVSCSPSFVFSLLRPSIRIGSEGVCETQEGLARRCAADL